MSSAELTTIQGVFQNTYYLIAHWQIYIMDPAIDSLDPDHVSQMNSILHEIQTMYDAGTPLFTKDNIRKVGEELQYFLKGERTGDEKITLKGFNGLEYEVLVQSRSSIPPRENERFGGSPW
jgi:hypothetical protein